MSDVAYFSTWRLHGNRVFKTRFISFINKIKSERNHQNIREEPRKKKKKTWKQIRSSQRGTTRTSEKNPGKKKKKTQKQKGREDQDQKSELVASDHCARPRPGARVPGRPKLREPQAACNPGLRLTRLGRRGLGLTRLGRRGLSLSLPLIWVSLPLWSKSLGLGLMFFSCICFWVFRPYMRLQIFLNFFGLEIDFQVYATWKKNITSDMINPWKSSPKNSIYRP